MRKLLLAIFGLSAIAAMVAIARCLRTPPLNSWAIVNLPPSPGPIVCFGDSLVSGVGADSSTDSYPRQLAHLLGREVVAVGIPGQTTDDGLKYLESGRLPVHGGIVIVTLGGNDMLRQVPWAKTQESLSRVFQFLQQEGTLVVFTAVEGLIKGRRGKRYRKLCAERGVVLVPDVLGHIRYDESLKSDPIHPNSMGYKIMAARVAEIVTPYLGTP